MIVYIVTLGEVSQNVLKKVANKLVENGAPLIDEVKIGLKMKIPPQAYDTERKQHKAEEMLNYAEARINVPEDGKLLIITPKDIFSEDFNFIFGQAKHGGKTAIVSLHRLRPNFYGEEHEPQNLLERLAKESLHELGHTNGLEHCSNSDCVMEFSNSIEDVDKKKLGFCEECKEKITNSEG